MENLHLYLFPAVGSLKEKRLAHFEASAKTELAKSKTEVADLKDTEDDVTKGDKAADQLKKTHEEVKKITDTAVTKDATERDSMLKAADAMKVELKTVKTEWSNKMTKIIAKNASKKVDEVKAAAAAVAPDPELAFKAGLEKVAAMPEPSTEMLLAYVNAIRDVRAAKFDKIALYPGTVKLADYVTPGAVTKAIETYNKATEQDEKLKKNPALIKDPTIPTVAKATEDYRTVLNKTKSEAVTRMTGAAGIDAKALAAAEYEEAARLLVELDKKAPVPTPDAEKIKEAEKAMEAEIKGVIDNKANKASLEALNKVIAGNKDKALAARGLINAKSPDLVFAEVTLGKDDKVVWEVRAKAGASSEVEKTLDEASSIKKIIELILKFLSEAGIIKSLGKNKDVSVNDIDNKIVELKAERTKIVADKSDPTGEKLKALDHEIKSLELARPVVVEAAKLGLTVKVDGKGKLVIYSEDESPAGKRRVAMIEDGLHKLPIRFGKNRGTFDFDAINPDQIKMLLNLFAKLAPFIMQRPGMPPNYGYQAPYMPHGYGAFAGAGPNGAIAGVNFGQKPQEFLGAGNSRAAS